MESIIVDTNLVSKELLSTFTEVLFEYIKPQLNELIFMHGYVQGVSEKQVEEIINQALFGNYKEMAEAIDLSFTYDHSIHNMSVFVKLKPGHDTIMTKFMMQEFIEFAAEKCKLSEKELDAI